MDTDHCQYFIVFEKRLTWCFPWPEPIFDTVYRAQPLPRASSGSGLQASPKPVSYTLSECWHFCYTPWYKYNNLLFFFFKEWEKFQQKLHKREKVLEGRSKVSHTVHCPLFPEEKQEYWWTYICDRKSRTLLTAPYHVTSLVDREECQLKVSLCFDVKSC